MVRLQPDLLAVLDRFAGELGATRPEALRGAFAQWAESAGLASHSSRGKEHPVMVFLPREAMERVIEETGERDVADAVSAIVTVWLRDAGRE